MMGIKANLANFDRKWAEYYNQMKDAQELSSLRYVLYSIQRRPLEKLILIVPVTSFQWFATEKEAHEEYIKRNLRKTQKGALTKDIDAAVDSGKLAVVAVTFAVSSSQAIWNKWIRL